jgi:hypothetical protein
LGAREQGDDKARIGLALGELRLGDDAPLAAPTLARQPLELLEGARRLAAAPALRLGLPSSSAILATSRSFFATPSTK